MQLTVIAGQAIQEAFPTSTERTGSSGTATGSSFCIRIVELFFCLSPFIYCIFMPNGHSILFMYWISVPSFQELLNPSSGCLTLNPLEGFMLHGVQKK